MNYELTGQNNGLKIEASNYTWIEVKLDSVLVANVKLSTSCSNAIEIGDLSPKTYVITSDGTIGTITPFNRDFKKFKITKTSESPSEKNINLFGLFRKDIFNSRGELITKEYYKNYDGTTYSDLVVKDSYIYTVNPANDLATYRDETIEWYLEDATIGETKDIKKYYNLTKSINEGIRRRENLLDQAKAYGLANIAGTHASGVPNSYYWFSTMTSAVRNYLDGTLKQDLIDFIDAETETYVTQTIKDTMTDILDYWTV